MRTLFRLNPRIRAILTLALVLSTTVSCAKRIDPATGIKTDATPYEQALAINASIAITVMEFNRAIIETHRSGFISTKTVDEITRRTFAIAINNKKLSEILKLGPEEAGKQSGEILRLSALIGQNARALVFRDDITAEDEEKLLTLTSGINSLFSLILNFTGQLKAAGVLP